MTAYIIELNSSMPREFCRWYNSNKGCTGCKVGRGGCELRDAMPVRELHNPDRVLWHKSKGTLRAWAAGE